MNPRVATPQQNEIAERKTRHNLNDTPTILFQTNAPKYFLGEAVLTAAYLINRVLSKVLGNKSPRQMLIKSYLDFLNIAKSFLESLDVPQLFKYTTRIELNLILELFGIYLLAISNTQKGYKCYHPLAR